MPIMSARRDLAFFVPAGALCTLVRRRFFAGHAFIMRAFAVVRVNDDEQHHRLAAPWTVGPLLHGLLPLRDQRFSTTTIQTPFALRPLSFPPLRSADLVQSIDDTVAHVRDTNTDGLADATIIAAVAADDVVFAVGLFGTGAAQLAERRATRVAPTLPPTVPKTLIAPLTGLCLAAKAGCRNLVFQHRRAGATLCRESRTVRLAVRVAICLNSKE